MQSTDTYAAPATTVAAEAIVHLDAVTVIYGSNRALKGVSAKLEP